MYNLKVAIFDEIMAVGKSKYLVVLYLYATFKTLDFSGSTDFGSISFFSHPPGLTIFLFMYLFLSESFYPANTLQPPWLLERLD